MSKGPARGWKVVVACSAVLLVGAMILLVALTLRVRVTTELVRREYTPIESALMDQLSDKRIFQVIDENLDSIDEVSPITGTPLHSAILKDRPNVVKYLVKSGADTTIKAVVFGEAKPINALDLAKRLQDDEVVQILSQTGDSTLREN